MGAILVGASAVSLAEIPTPTAIKFGYNDVSSADAGRTNDANVTMHPNKIATKRTISLTWNNLGGEATRAVLQAFRPEIVYVQYLEPEENAYVVRPFYTGNRSVDVGTYYPTRDYTIGGVAYKTVSFNVIEV